MKLSVTQKYVDDNVKSVEKKKKKIKGIIAYIRRRSVECVSRKGDGLI